MTTQGTPSRTVSANSPTLHDSVTSSLKDSFFAELTEVGYDRLTLEAVARRAGSGKAAIYRRWKSKQAMLIELLEEVTVPVTPAPDTGSLDGDVRAFLIMTAEQLMRPRVLQILPDLLATRTFHPAVADSLRGVGAKRRITALSILERAIARGEMHASASIDISLDLLAGPLYWGLVVRRGDNSPEYIEDLSAMIVAALRAARS